MLCFVCSGLVVACVAGRRLHSSKVETKVERELAYAHGITEFPGVLLFQVAEKRERKRKRVSSIEAAVCFVALLLSLRSCVRV